jgi:D-alanyl-D-alanine carboxypeptidase
MNGYRRLLSILFLLTVGTAQAQTRTPKLPNVRAAAAIVLDANTGSVLFAKNPDKRLPPASTTKIMTAWLLARDTKPEQVIVTPPEATGTQGSILGMAPGEKFTARDLLYAILLPSANDASIAAAQHSAGSVSAFVARMNEEAQQLGLPNTNFVNPNGLPAPNHFSSARDLAHLAQNALLDPTFATAVRAQTYLVPRANRPPTKIVNKNELLGTVPGMDGVKTGQTREAGYCFVGSATRNGRRIITVVLNSPNWQAETVALLNYGFARKARTPAPSKVQGTAAQPARRTETPNTDAKNSAARPNTTPPASVPPTPNRMQTDTPVSKGTAPVTRNTSPPSVGSSSRGNTSASGGGVATGSSGTVPSGWGREGGGSGRTPSAGTPVSTSADSGTQVTPTMPNGETSPNAPVKTASSTARSTYSPRTGLTTEKTTLAGRGSLDTARNGTRTRAEFRETPPRPLRHDWLWWLLLLLLLLAASLLWHFLRTGKFTMNPANFWPFGKRKKQQESLLSSPEKTTGHRRAPSETGANATPPFAFVPPHLERIPGNNWLHALLENMPRLLEPAVRRQAQAVIAANPALDLEKVFALLSAPKPKTRVLGAELLIDVAPHQVEETLVALIEDEKTPTDVRSEAIDLLAKHSGDRYESFFLKTLARDGSQAAARALACLPRLDTKTIAALRHIIATQRPPERDADSELRTHLLAAQSACVLGAHGLMPHEEIKPVLDRLPTNHREQALTGTLRGVTSPWAVERMVQIALKGQATYPALHNLLECDPRQVRTALEALPELDSAARTRATVLRRLLFGEGDTESLRKLAEAGDDTANNALKLERLYRWHPSQASLDALLAASMLTSLRLGFTTHTPEQIAPVFRTVGEDGRGSMAATPELEPLRQAYSHPEVYDAVQVALNTEDGAGLIASALCQSQENRAFQEEMAFWSDKCPTGPRLSITQSLATCDTDSAREALAARATDPEALIRASALRTLYRYGNSVVAPVTEIADDKSHTEPTENTEAMELDKAA